MAVKKTTISSKKREEIDVLTSTTQAVATTTFKPTTEPYTTPEPTTEPYDDETTTIDVTTAPVEDDDSDMPVQESKTYKTYVVPKPFFINLLKKMPYNLQFGYGGYPGIRMYVLSDLIKWLESKDKFEVDEINGLIGIIASGPYTIVVEFMSYVQDTDKQQELWTLVQDK